MSSELPARVQGITPGLTIREVTGCNGRRSVVADWLCACGHHERASGKTAVTALASSVIVGHCPHREGRAAA
ncbi:hypothetical protein [Streptomyces sp. RK76]|uniref:hypothetical protein n=1 Tax=Streptomyces sp. RK76 TaxID=2824896 RepID=UPI0027E41789|nr:hypothetical protein [Streptomyces sp. RK76]